jgi:hypothetical protein
MKYLLVTLLFLLTSFLGFGQSVSAPDSKSFIPSTSGQDASGFSLSGFSTTSTLLASISLVNPPTGTTFVLNTTTGLTASSGFTLSGNKTRLVVTGTMVDINTALASLKVNTGSIKGNVLLSVAATINPTGYFYNGVNGHFYRPISTGATYTNARILSEATTFKGQKGYLVTITSADEDLFIFNNVPQSSIWFALTDEETEGQWKIDAGPEKGTLIKTSNGQTAGNIQGQYNNWAGGEPNNSGNEDYAVTKWGGGSQWNDLPNGFSCAYVIEFGTWTNPDDATFTEFYTNSVTHSNGEVLTARFNFDFGSNVDETKFSAKANKYVNNVWGVTTNTARALSGLGKADITNDLDTTKYPTGTKYISLTPGEIEFCVIYEYDATNKRYRVGLDSRLWQYTQNAPVWNDVKNLKLFDLYNGPVVPNSTGSGDVWWNEYYIYTDTQFNYANSSYQSNLRNGGGYYALKLASTFTFGDNTSLVQHGIDLSYTNQNDLNTLYNSVVTVSDVFIAFKELANGGLFGNESGNEFTSGIQYMNADVDGNGLFNEADTYKLLQHLTGVQSLTEFSTLTYLMKLYSKSDYDAITKSNWNTRFNSTRSLYPFSLNTGTLNNTYNVNVTWKGDINLSHSAKQSVSSVTSNSIRTMSLSTNSVSNEVTALIMSENVGNKIIVTISLDPLQQEVVGTQFQLNYDNSVLKFEKVEFTTKGNPMNYGTNKGNYINLGSLITDGSTSLDKTTEYKIIFTPLTQIGSILGLTSISTTDAVNKNGTSLKIKLN